MLVVNLLAFYTVATSVKAELDLMPFVSIRLYIELYPMSKEDFNWTKQLEHCYTHQNASRIQNNTPVALS